MLRCLLHILLVLFMSSSIASARVKLIRLDELPGLAEVVIEGTVIDKTARWDAKGIMINTHYTIDVHTVIKGEAPDTLKLSFAGGTVAGKTIKVTHTPNLEVGQTYILFNYADNRYSVPTIGHEQGVFKVIHDTLSKQDRIVDYHGYQIERTSGRQQLVRGILTRVDAQGALVQRQITQQIVSPPLKPIVRDANGRIVPQNDEDAAAQAIRSPSEPVTRTEFIQFIKKPMRNSKGGK